MRSGKYQLNLGSEGGGDTVRGGHPSWQEEQCLSLTLAGWGPGHPNVLAFPMEDWSLVYVFFINRYYLFLEVFSSWRRILGGYRGLKCPSHQKHLQSPSVWRLFWDCAGCWVWFPFPQSSWWEGRNVELPLGALDLMEDCEPKQVVDLRTFTFGERITCKDILINLVC